MNKYVIIMPLFPRFCAQWQTKSKSASKFEALCRDYSYYPINEIDVNRHWSNCNPYYFTQ